MNIFDSSGSDKQENTSPPPPPLTPVINDVLSPSGEVNYNALPSLASLLSIPSSNASSMASPITPRKTRRKRKLPTRAMPIVRAKTTKKALIVSYKWKKAQFKHKADIQSNDFVFDLPNTDSPLDFFYRFMSPDILIDIVDNSNLYSTHRTGKCMQLTIEQLKDFLAILLIMGIVKMPSYLDYWSTEFRYAQVADIMPLKRFEQIRRNIHFVDNTYPDEDRYYKIRPFIEKIRRNCLSTEEEMKYSIDEMTIPYKGTKAGNRRQYNPMKPNKWGFKNLVRAGASGIVYDFLLYGGDDTFRYIDFSEEEQQMTLGAKMVLALCKTIETPGCAVYFDNYFTTLDLIWYLRERRGIFSLGTIRQNRLKGCTNGLLSDKELKKRGRGSFSQVVDNDKKIAIVKWYDNKVVTLACSYADSYPVHEIKRWSKEQKKKVGVPCPQLVRYYNQHMGVVDLCDMLIALYRISFKSRRWYMNIFGQMLDIAVNNAWLLYKRKCNKKSLKNISLKKFRQRLAVELTQKGRSVQIEAPSQLSKKVLIQNPSKPRPPDSVRYDGYSHWPEYTTYGR
ncbi:piggyBac transposable element-derived protein 3-like, partial [Bombyx mandarina]|uniref:PiggyBac transposable element-derived protein 3-like n=1 Tax=Bombyx mandarina TaxID=7092 RepID=A0A6J2KJT2_BOMMA